MAKDLIDFMSDSLNDPALYGEFLSIIHATPKPSNKKLSTWFKKKGYVVSPGDCKRGRKLVGLTATRPVPHY
jgi:hypothetical protein